MAKKKILFVYTDMIIGGSTTSLLAILNSINFEHYAVDLLLFGSGGPLSCEIPGEVTVLNNGQFKVGYPRVAIIRRLLSARYMLSWFRAVGLSLRYRNPLIRSQILSESIVRFFPKSPEEYDTAVAFLEFLPVQYVARRVRAKRKVAWLHVDYMETRLLPMVENDAFSCFDKIVLVSDANRANFNRLYPMFADRTIRVENLVTPALIQRRATLERSADSHNVRLPERLTVKFVSASRIDFASKGLDRAVRAIRELLDEGLQSDFHWWIIGDGPDADALASLIRKMNLESMITCVGSMLNPFPLMRKMDVFIIPSIYEGKPMAVTEALFLGLPVLATNYASAAEQIRHGVDGLIVENTQEGICHGIRTLVENPDLLGKLALGAKTRSFESDHVMEEITALLSGTS